MTWAAESIEAQLRRRIAFLEGQLRSATRLATEASALMVENNELRRRQEWLEHRVNELELQLAHEIAVLA